VTALALLVSWFVPSALRASWGSSLQIVGTLSIQLFFATIGATTDLRVLFASAALWPLVSMVLLTLGVHGLVLGLFGRRLLGLRVRDLLLASNAAVGGPATAAAMAAAMGWNERVSSAVMCGTIGYAIGTLVGIAVGLVCNGFSLL
jgi:uncharacterized membrane protein